MNEPLVRRFPHDRRAAAAAAMAAVCAALAVPRAQAAVVCGGSVSGAVTLSADLSCPGVALTISQPGTVLDCVSHAITFGTAGTGAGVVVSSAAGVSVRNCAIAPGSTAVGASPALAAYSADSLIVEASTFTSPVLINGGVGPVFRNNVMSVLSELHQLVLVSYATAPVVIGNFVEVGAYSVNGWPNGPAAVNLSYDTGGSVTSNIIRVHYRTDALGIYFSSDIQIASNTITAGLDQWGSGSGVVLYADDRPQVSDNSITILQGAGGSFGVGVSYGNSALITRNAINSAGVGVATGASGYGSQTRDTEISSNTILSQYSYGIIVSDNGSFGRNRVIGNDIKAINALASTTAGGIAWQADGGFVVGNRIRGYGGYTKGLFLNGSARSTVVSSNTITTYRDNSPALVVIGSYVDPQTRISNNISTTYGGPGSPALYLESTQMVSPITDGVFTAYGDAAASFEYGAAAALTRNVLVSSVAFLSAGQAGASGNVILSSNVFQSSQTAVMFPGPISVPSKAYVSVNDLRLAFNEVHLSSTAAFLANAPARIDFSGLSLSSPVAQVDYQDTEAFVACPTSLCRPLSYAGGVFSFQVAHFTGYSSREAPAPPSAVADLTASAGSVPGSALLRWTAPKAFADGQYLIAYSTGPTRPSLSDAQVLVSTNGVISGQAQGVVLYLHPNVSYTFSLWSRSAIGTSPASNQATALTLAAPPVPTVFSGLPSGVALNLFPYNTIAALGTDPTGALWGTWWNGSALRRISPPFYNGKGIDVELAWDYWDPLGDILPNFAFDSQGNLWAQSLFYRGSRQSYLLEFKPPFVSGLRPSLAVPVNFDLGAGPPMHWDAQGGLWIAQATTLNRYVPPFSSSMQPVASLTGLTWANYGIGFAVDAKGNIWVPDGYRLLVYSPPFTTGMTPTTVYSLPRTPANVAAAITAAFDASGNLWLTDAQGIAGKYVPPFADGMTPEVTLYGYYRNMTVDSSGSVWIGEQNPHGYFPSGIVQAAWNAVSLAWGSNGNASGSTYGIQLSTDPTFSPALTVTLSTTALSTTVGGLTPKTTYYFRAQAFNAAGAATAFASLGSTVTPAPFDQTPPVTALLVDGQAVASSSLTVISTDSIGFVAVDTESGVAQTLYALDGSTAAVVFVSTFSLPAGAHALSYHSVDRAGNVEPAKTAWLNVMPLDSQPPRTTLLVGSPRWGAAPIDVGPSTPLGFSAVDDRWVVGDGIGLGVARTLFAVDSGAFAVYAGTFTLAAEGPHTLRFYSVDAVGNAEAAQTAAIAVDATPPVSALSVGQPQFALSGTAVLVSALTPLGVAAVDPVSNGVASGVRQTFYAVDGSSFAVFPGSFTLAGPDGPRAISFYSQDNVLNTEAAKVVSVVLDATPPAVALLSPGSCPGGICRVVKGWIPVLGSATDLHFASYALDAAPGQGATAGFALISSGTVAVSSGVLGVWDASALTGWQTLRLTATDLVANVSVVAIDVFVGDPGELMILGNHDVFNMPQGVAADAAGDIYVADTNADRIAIFTATGAFVTAYGRPHGDEDDHVSSTTLRLNKPKGVAVDPAGSVYVADTNDDRVLKLSAAGQVLLSIGRQSRNGEAHPGKGPGEFNKPSGVALDAAGNIYVADTNNDRVQVLNSTGAPILAFSLPALPKVHDDEKADHDDDQTTLGRPFGIAVDAAGRIYVADPFGSRALVFGATGQLLLTLPITGTTKDGHLLPGRPEGVAVSTDGYCLLVSDRKFDRVLKFDSLGDPTLAFGAPGHYDARQPLAGIVFHKPVGLALAPDGTLLVADRNNDRVERFGLPTGKTLVVPPSENGDRNALAEDVLDGDAGGTVARADKAGVTIPPGALPDDLKITVSTISAVRAAQGAAMDQVASDKGLAPAYAPVEYGPEGTQFNVPVSIVQPYDPDLVAAAGMSEDSLAVHYWNPAKNDWEALASTVDKAAHTVTAKTPHFSLYQVLGSTGTALKPLASADPTFTFRAGYAFPNPVRGTSAVTIRLQPGLADSVEVHVYDLSGRKVHSSSDFAQNILDDGNGLGAQYTFDHIWSVSGVGSGVYTYVITARKAGMPDIHKSGKIGVIK